MVKFELSEGAELTEKEKKLLAQAAKRPAVYDEDSPELTPELEAAFAAARKAKPYQGEPVTLYVSPATLEKAKRISRDYQAVLGELLEKAVEEYQAAP